ncbi:DUF92 domain-containing protein [Neobacillus dielmonensis]|uniref:DUF92 domain-containing protein n=1 Tax=Neobacillus dielmonensis TaxID=1347369 RepID=UPI0005A9CB39|nr:DUF92 domain-containing protein [Neobacillus dielmonensis]
MSQLSFLITVIIAGGLAGYYLRFLDKSGAFASIVVGICILLGLGLNGLLLLGIFFVTSSYWSGYKKAAKLNMEEKLAKGSTRDWRQVAVNGGAASLFSLIYYFHPNSIWVVGFATSLASANSDTWASEIGSLSNKDPIFIRTMKPVEKGTSGAVSSLGSLSALAGSLLIAFMSYWLFKLDILVSLTIFVFGYIGNVIDTLIGAFFQQTYHCQVCGITTEKKVHCTHPTAKIKGITFIDNDMVNFLSGLLASIAAMGIFL